MASPMVLWAVILLLVRISTTSPSISFPINSQVPPVARVGQPFSFVFSPSTFSSESTIAYALANSPGWLALDSEARRLFGTPRDGDIAPGEVAGVAVNLVATDDTGSTALDATLVVSRNPGPKVDVPFENQAPLFGTFSRPSSILSPPNTHFSFDLSQHTFSNPSASPLKYYAVMADNTPLPAWILFDPGNLSFSGRTPSSDSLIEPPQLFSFQLCASDVVGFAAASLKFDIVVGNHKIHTDQDTIILATKVGTPVSYTGLRDSIRVDGEIASADEVIISETPGIPSWLSVDKSSGHITGVPPENAVSTSFIVVVRDSFSDTLNLTVLVNITDTASQNSGFLEGKIPDLTATAGEHFSFELRPYIADLEDTDIVLMPPSSWVRFDGRTATVYGDVPKGSRDAIVSVDLRAKSKRSGNSDAISLSINIRSPSKEVGATPTSTFSDPTTNPSTNGVFPDSYDVESPRPKVVLLVVLLPTLLSLLAVTCLLFWCSRRRNSRPRPQLSTRDISGPLQGALVTNLGEHRSQHRDGSPVKSTTSINAYEEARASYLKNIDADIPRPLALVRLLKSPERKQSTTCDYLDMHNAFLTPSRTPEHARYQSQNNGSSSSVSEASMPSGAVSQNFLTLLENGSMSSFRDAVETAIPYFGEQLSIQQTPASAYTGTGTGIASNQWESDSKSSSSAEISFADTNQESLPLRPNSRLDHYPQNSPTRKFAWPWLKGGPAKGNMARLSREASKRARRISTSSIDTFAYKKPAGKMKGPMHENANSMPFCSRSPPFAKLPEPPTPTRPLTRRGPNAGLGFRFQSSPLRDQEENRDNETTGKTTAGESHKFGLSALPEQQKRDISYADLVKKSLLHPSSKTWSTVPSTDERENVTVQSQCDPIGHDSNWALLEDFTSHRRLGLKELQPARVLATEPAPSRIYSCQAHLRGGRHRRREKSSFDGSGKQPGGTWAKTTQ
ncbi:hypothetical protein B0H63DRAFT_525809 [Podospora didyma]|uniref:Dystroglycan-type cadherin-like domain-containing protein n=1 Tax=Podospora didyma TaxID=330526 RepID=A0AAE0KL22_9PEZI|nr:hypothetical protein B0H63DRAFT_525809 [Podospora didyma]